ncbi:uncharacterized protein LOC139909615 [Centroberyx gerrardi]|uniref:uncharacterized protein n=1 Tax=Centroberyx gerrardi TaxID=166262 RepID=UPI003AADE5D7
MLPVESVASNGADESAVVKAGKKGWLRKRSRFTHRWKQTWVQLEGCQLLYGETEEKAAKRISLGGAVLETEEGSGAFEWSITARDSKRSLRLRAGGAAERQAWMLALCEAQVRSAPHANTACVLQ